MLFLKQSTAAQARLLGPFVDDTDGATAETGLTVANTDIRLSKNGGNMVAKNLGGGTHDENGWYTTTLDATDTATVGSLQVSCKVAGALAVFMEFTVLEENVYDAWFGASAAAGTDLASILTDTADMQPRVVAIEVDTGTTLDGRIPAALVGGRMDSDIGAKTGNVALSAQEKLDANAEADTAITDAALGTAANLATVDTVVDGMQTDLSNGTDGLGALKTLIDAVQSDATGIKAITDLLTLAAINAEVDTAFTTIMVDSVPADGTIPSREQAMYMIVQFLTDFVISGTTRTTRKVNGSTTLMTHNLDDGTSPTALTRAT